MKIPESERRQLALNKKLDAILDVLGFKVENCYHCDDGIRECGLRSDPELHRCYHCGGSTIHIEKKDKGWDGD